MIENLREQKEREDRARLEELEQMRKENQELKEKLAAVQPQKLSQSQLANPGLTQTQRPEVGINILTLLSFKGDSVFLISAVTKFGHHVVIICEIFLSSREAQNKKMRLALETERACVLIRASYTTPQGCSSGMRADG